MKLVFSISIIFLIVALGYIFYEIYNKFDSLDRSIYSLYEEIEREKAETQALKIQLTEKMIYVDENLQTVQSNIGGLSTAFEKELNNLQDKTNKEVNRLNNRLGNACAQELEDSGAVLWNLCD